MYHAIARLTVPNLSCLGEHSISALSTRLLFVANMLTVFLSFCYIYKDFVQNWWRFWRPSVIFVPVKCPRGGGIWSPECPSVGHLNGILARVGGNLNNNFQKSQMPGGLPGGMLKLRFDRYIIVKRFVIITELNLETAEFLAVGFCDFGKTLFNARH